MSLMGAVIGAGISAGGKLWSDRKARKADRGGGGGYDRAGGWYDKMGGMGDRFQGMFDENWGDFEGQYADLLRKGVDEDLYVGRAGADVQQAYGKSEEMAGRQMSRMGINPSSGRMQQMMENSQYARGLAEVGARGDARMQAQQMNLQMAGQGAQMGRGLLQAAGGAYGGAGGGYGQLAGIQQKGAEASGKGWGSFFGGLSGIGEKAGDAYAKKQGDDWWGS